MLTDGQKVIELNCQLYQLAIQTINFLGNSLILSSITLTINVWMYYNLQSIDLVEQVLSTNIVGWLSWLDFLLKVLHLKRPHMFKDSHSNEIGAHLLWEDMTWFVMIISAKVRRGLVFKDVGRKIVVFIVWSSWWWSRSRCTRSSWHKQSRPGLRDDRLWRSLRQPPSPISRNEPDIWYRYHSNQQR